MPNVNSPRAWFLATRPKTLTGAIVPVAIALSLAWHDLSCASLSSTFQWVPAALCLLFACLMQIDANLVNDYYDCKRGIDGEDRLGPERACSQGWITLPAMKRALMLVTTLSALVGMPLVYWGGWEMILVGLACILFCYLYTTLLSGCAMGDVLVLLFFGLVPVCVTYYLQIGTITIHCVLLALGCGLATELLLVVNNFRDRHTDLKHGKITLVTVIGEQATLALYALCGTLAFILAHVALSAADVHPYLLFLYLPVFILSFHRMRTIRQGRQLNAVLGLVALSILVYGLTITTLLIFHF